MPLRVKLISNQSDSLNNCMEFIPVLEHSLVERALHHNSEEYEIHSFLCLELNIIMRGECVLDGFFDVLQIEALFSIPRQVTSFWVSSAARSMVRWIVDELLHRLLDHAILRNIPSQLGHV